jgi:hypothetical protein
MRCLENLRIPYTEEIRNLVNPHFSFTHCVNMCRECCRSGMFIPDPYLPILDPESRGIMAPDPEYAKKNVFNSKIVTKLWEI